MSMHKIYRFFGTLSVENGSLCPDTTIEIKYYKNGRKHIKVFDGVCDKPYINIRSTDVSENKFVEPYIKGNAKYNVITTDIS